MIISHISQIENLFINQISESQFIDYKREIYKIHKSQNTNNDDIQLNKYELLKDICSFLNSDGGVILIGIAENEKTGLPSGEFQKSGIILSTLPDKYTENLEQLILTGISPAPAIKIETHQNNLNPSNGFIAINIPGQNYPLFSLLRDGKGNETTEIIVRRGRHKNKMNLEEIKRRLQQFEERKAIYKAMMEEKSKEFMDGYGDKFPMLLMFAYPSSTPLNQNFVGNEALMEFLRGKDSWERKGYKISINELNTFPQPTFEGLSISVPSHHFEIWENGLVISCINFQSDFEISRKRLTDDNWNLTNTTIYTLDPAAVEGYISNFFRQSLKFYNQINFIGEIQFSISLLNLHSSQTFAYRQKEGHINPSAVAKQGELIKKSSLNDFYGPRKSQGNIVKITREVQSYDYNEKELDKLDTFVKSSVLDYIWRAYKYDSFPS
jgi:hypothetical protein